MMAGPQKWRRVLVGTLVVGLTLFAIPTILVVTGIAFTIASQSARFFLALIGLAGVFLAMCAVAGLMFSSQWWRAARQDGSN